MAVGIGMDRANDRAAEGPGEAPLARGREGSVRIASAAMAWEPAPLAYDVQYRLEDTATSVADITTAHIRVRRPYESHVVLRKGEPPGGEVTVERLSRFGELGLIGGDGKERQILSIPPALAGSDLRPDIGLDDALEAGMVERREQRRVAGTRCQVWRLGTSVSAGELLAVGSRKDEYADACFDSRGLLLEEVWVLDGRRVRRRIVTSLDLQPTFPAGEFELTGARVVPEAEGGGSVRSVDPASTPPGLFVLPAPPEGFTLQGRYAVLPPRTDPQANPLTESENPRQVGVFDVWTRGADTIIIDQGPGNPFDPHPAGEPVEVEAIGKGLAILDLRSNEIRFQNPSGYLRIFGTLTRAKLLTIAAQLHPAP